MNRKGINEWQRFRLDYERWLKSIRVSPAELSETHALARQKHQHDFRITRGLATILIECKTCPMRQGLFQPWVTGR